MTSKELKQLFENAINCPQEPIMFFAGSGISINSGLPDFKTFSKHLIKSLTWLFRDRNDEHYRCILDEKEIQELADFIRPEVLLQAAHEVAKDRVFLFYEWLESQPPNYYHYYLAIAIHQGHYVFTPNIDRLIEDAYKILYPNEKLRVIVTDSEYGDFNKIWSSKKTTEMPGALFKVHGTIEESTQGGVRHDDDKYKSIRFLLKQVGQGVSPNVKQVMEKCIESYDLVFIGYSGCDHFSNQPVLQCTETVKKTYWLWYDDRDYKESDRDKKHQTGELVTFSRDNFDTMPVGDKIVSDIRKHREERKPYLAFPRAMEINSVKDFLHARRSSCFVFQGHIGKFIEEIVASTNPPQEFVEKIKSKLAPYPDFLTRLRLFDRLYAAALFLFYRRSLHLAEKFADSALKYCEHTNDFVTIRCLLAKIFDAHSDEAHSSQAIKQLEKVIAKCKNYSECHPDRTEMEIACNAIEASVEIVNIVRRKKPQPQEVEAKIQTAEEIIERYRNNVEDKFLKELSLRLRIYRGRLLVDSENTWQKGIQELSDVEKELSPSESQCRETVDVRWQAYTQNALGLAFHLQAERDRNNEVKKERISKSKEWLYKSLELNTFIGDEWEKFRNYRNLGLAYALQAETTSNSTEKPIALETALEKFREARDCFPPSTPDDFLGEKMEAKFRIAETCGRIITLSQSQDSKDELRKEALEEIKAIAEFRKKKSEDHNLARALHVKFLLTGDKAGHCEICAEIVEVYRAIINDNNKGARWFKEGKHHIPNAKSILKDILKNCDDKQCNNHSEVENIQEFIVGIE